MNVQCSNDDCQDIMKHLSGVATPITPKKETLPNSAQK